MFIILLLVAIIICLCSLVLSIVWSRKQQGKKLDKGMNRVSVKHRVVANPIFLAYVLFPVLVFSLVALLLYYTQ